MKNRYLGILFIVFAASILCAKGQESPESISSVFFQKLEQSGSVDAVDYIYSTNPYIMDDTARINKTRNEFKSLEKTRGNYCGYELISKEETSASFITYSYLVKYEKAPLIVDIFYYKPKQLWQVTFVEVTNPIKNDRERNQGMKQQGNKQQQQGNFNKNSNSGNKTRTNTQNK
jgi:hypothetical protein